MHAQTEPDISQLKEAAGCGAHVDLDVVGDPYQSQPELLEMAVALIESGLIDHLLLSQDAGWYNPARPDGLPEEGYRGHTAFTADFLSALRKRGITEEQLQTITPQNPARAFAF